MFDRPLVFLLALPAAGLLAQEEIEVSAVLVMADKTEVALSNKATGATQLVAIGRKFAGFTVSAYDAKQNVVVLTKDGKETRVRLKSGGNIREAPAGIPAAAVSSGPLPGAAAGPMAAPAPMVFQIPANADPAAVKAILNNFRQLRAAADQFFLEKGANRASYNDLVGATKYIKVIKPVAGENYTGLQFLLGQQVILRSTDPKVGDIKLR